MDTSSISRLDTLPTAPAVAAPVAAPVSWAILPTTAVPPASAGADANNSQSGNKTPSKADVKRSVDAINRAVQNNSEVHFSIDESSGLSVVKVIDTETKKVLRQFPSEQSLEIAKNLHSLKGLLIDSQA